LKILDFRLPIVFCLLTLHAFGFEATMTVQPPLIQLGETATLSIEVRGAKNISPPALPNVPGLRFSGASQSQQTSWVNGKTDSSTSFSFQIAPQQTGTFKIGPFDYKVDGETKTLQGELKVVSTSGDAAQPQSWSDIIFARLLVDRESAYVQEPFGMTLSIYSRQGLQMAGNINLQGMPGAGLDGLQWQEVQGGREVINNIIYDIRRFQTRTRAVSSGVFEFKPSITVQVVVPNQNNRSNDPFFGSFFQRTETRPVDLPVEKSAITVKPLPEISKPSGFSGAVGRFDFAVSAQPLEIHPGDPITLTMTVIGDGNFDRVMPPALPTNGLFRLFGEPVRKQENNAVKFEQVVSPRTADAKEIPAIPFSFFDTKTGQYRTVNSKPIPIIVTATSNSTAQVFAAKDSIVLPSPETPFATESDLQRIEGQVKILWQTVRPWLWAIPAALVLGIVLFLGQRLHRNRQSDTVRVRRQKAPKAARKALRAADHARRHDDATAFYDALWNALADYFGNRLNLPPGDVTPTTVLKALGRAGFNPEQINTTHAIFEQVEARRYGQPGAVSPESMEKLQSGLEQILKQCEKAKF
jgi:hypothetical protein